MANHVVGYFDAPNQRIVLQVVDDSNTVNTGFASVVIALADGNVQPISLREWPVCVDDGTGTLVQKHAIFLSSAAY